jgi:hypothetical protein
VVLFVVLAFSLIPVTNDTRKNARRARSTNRAVWIQNLQGIKKMCVGGGVWMWPKNSFGGGDFVDYSECVYVGRSTA